MEVLGQDAKIAEVQPKIEDEKGVQKEGEEKNKKKPAGNQDAKQNNKKPKQKANENTNDAKYKGLKKQIKEKKKMEEQLKQLKEERKKKLEDFKKKVQQKKKNPKAAKASKPVELPPEKVEEVKKSDPIAHIQPNEDLKPGKPPMYQNPKSEAHRLNQSEFNKVICYKKIV